MGFAFRRLRHSAKLPEYMPHPFNRGVTVLNRAGHTDNLDYKLRPKVAARTVPNENAPKMGNVIIPMLKR